ncbi:Pycsar system effector family protein [Pedobacter sp. MW01-1-1]|uniref:Pycsar system effector family protein n=1 Tax=Pedobacter sp. MW01-1-1 TaxID=3383027 RepID=UPI003FED6F7B
MNYSELQADIDVYIHKYYEERNDPRLVYHNLDHTIGVLNAAKQIANHYQLNEEDFFCVVVAAYFHDTGYFQDPFNHEEKGAALADAFLQERGLNEAIRGKVKQAILSTKLPQQPKTLIDKIICDADLFHLGLPDFRKKSKRMHQEKSLLYQTEKSKVECKGQDIQFMEQQHYHTDYAQLLLNDQKQKNIEKLKSKLSVQNLITVEEQAPGNTTFFKEEDKKKDKNERPDKGIETLFRITSANNQRLSDMADNKAHILITVNSIMLSLIVSLLLRRLDEHGNLIIPTFILLMVCLVCVVVSILSTRPSVPKGEFTKDDLEQKKVNLLFFGNFYNMSLQDYKEGMSKVMDSKEFLYGTLITDVYSQGVVLGRKYKLIRIAYNVFMFGLIAAVISFVLAYTIHGKF